MSAFGRTHAEQTLETYYNGFGGGWRWRGSATSILSEKPEKNEKKLEQSVADMFKKFPPSRD